MASSARLPGVSKIESTSLVLFIPSVDRNMTAVDQQRWVAAALQALGTWFGGATALPRGQGVWRDDKLGRLVYDNPVVILCYTNDAAITQRKDDLIRFLDEMGTKTNQGAVGFVIDDNYCEISFPVRRRSRK